MWLEKIVNCLKKFKICYELLDWIPNIKLKEINLHFAVMVFFFVGCPSKINQVVVMKGLTTSNLI